MNGLTIPPGGLPRRGSIRARFGISIAVPLVLALGRIARKKGLVEVVQRYQICHRCMYSSWVLIRGMARCRRSSEPPERLAHVCTWTRGGFGVKTSSSPTPMPTASSFRLERRTSGMPRPRRLRWGCRSSSQMNAAWPRSWTGPPIGSWRPATSATRRRSPTHHPCRSREGRRSGRWSPFEARLGRAFERSARALPGCCRQMRTIAGEAAALVICPRDGSQLSWGDDALCERGHRFPIVAGIPVLFGERDPTGFASRTIDKLANEGYTSADVAPPSDRVDAVVQEALLGTNGNLYRHLVGKLDRYPIPAIRLPPGDGRLLLDVGGGWGRWSFAAVQAGYRPVVIDPQLDLLLAATRVSEQLDLDITAICGDATALPFAGGAFMSSFPTPCSNTSPAGGAGCDG